MLPSCSDSGDTSDSDASAAVFDGDVSVIDAMPNAIDAGALLTIPDPETGDSNNWFDVLTEANDSPDNAVAVGVVTNPVSYIGGTLNALSGVGYWVLKTGPASTSVTLGTNQAFEFMHLHDGANLNFGAELVPTTYTCTVDCTGTWPVAPDSVYVLEIKQPGGGYF